MTFQDKYNSLAAILKKLEKVVVAYSGGVDSTFLLKGRLRRLKYTKFWTLSIRQIIPTAVFTANLISTQFCKTSLRKRDLEVLFAAVISTTWTISDPAIKQPGYTVSSLLWPKPK